jgi:hypothetical protein
MVGWLVDCVVRWLEGCVHENTVHFIPTFLNSIEVTCVQTFVAVSSWHDCVFLAKSVMRPLLVSDL